MLRKISLLLLLMLILLVATRGALLSRRGINAFLFGQTARSDFLLLPVVALLLYTLLAGAFAWPYPRALIAPLWHAPAVGWVGCVLSLLALVWFALSLVSFGDSFRVGIDESKPGELVTSGTFAISRNPIYVAFLAFFLGLLLVHANWALVIILAVLAAAIHRQIRREEQFLRGRYGADYAEYCRRVRRYL